MGGMGDSNMAFAAGATSMGDGGGATMEGLPGMGGPGPMAMAASPMNMAMPGGGMEGGAPMEMPNMGGPGGADGGLMSKQFIEGGGGRSCLYAARLWQ